MIYNKPDTVFFKTAAKMQAQAEPLLEEASQIIQDARVDPASGILVDPLPASYFLRNQVPHPHFSESTQQQPRGDRRSSSEDRRKGKQRDAEPFNFAERNADEEEEPNGSAHPLSSYLDFGQKVRARWTNGQFYHATVCLVRRESNTVQVVFDDGLLGVSC